MTLEDFQQKIIEIINSKYGMYKYNLFYIDHATGNIMDLEFEYPHIYNMDEIKELGNARFLNSKWENYRFLKYEVKKI